MENTSKIIESKLQAYFSDRFLSVDKRIKAELQHVEELRWTFGELVQESIILSSRGLK